MKEKINNNSVWGLNQNLKKFISLDCEISVLKLVRIGKMVISCENNDQKFVMDNLELNIVNFIDYLKHKNLYKCFFKKVVDMFLKK